MSRVAAFVAFVSMGLLACQLLAQDVLPPAKSSPPTVGIGQLDSKAVKPGVWYKRSPLPDGPKNPRMGYEGAWAYDPYSKVILRWGGHNQGGGGEQNSEMWVYDPASNVFKLMEPNYWPPGSCCCRDNVFDIAAGKYVRFPAFSASHGWQWRREVYQMQSSVWTYDYPSNQWRNMRPWPAASPGPLRGAAYDTDDDVTVVAQGEGVRWGTAVYDLYTNTWTMLNAKNEPPERNTFGFAYDPVGRKFVSFGSQGGRDPKTWVFDLRKNEWQGLDLTPHPPEVRNGAVMAYDPFNKIVLCVALTWKDGIDPDDKTPTKVPNELETWAFDPAKTAWTKVDTKGDPDVSGSRARLMLFDPDLNLFVLESRTNKEMGEWVFRYADYAAPKDGPPLPPTELKAVTAADSVTLSWKASESKNATGTVIFRGTAEKPWLVDYAKIGTADGSARSFTDKDVKPGTIYYYYVAATDRAGKPGPASWKARSQPPVIVDMVVSAVDAKKVELAWDKGGPDVVGYNVYRAPVTTLSAEQNLSIRDKHKLTSPPPEPFLGTWKVGEFKKLNDAPVATASLTDTGVDLAQPPAPPEVSDKSIDAKAKPYKWAVYAYRVTAVNRLGVESGPSPYYLTVPGPVRDLKSRERPGQTDLKWTANAEKGIQGYRVYRLEGRSESNRVTMISPERVKGTTFTDKIANSPNDDAKRYYVVAVDALGQEGIVGSPTWGDREYAKYYVGFLGEWHQ